MALKRGVTKEGVCYIRRGALGKKILEGVCYISLSVCYIRALENT